MIIIRTFMQLWLDYLSKASGQLLPKFSARYFISLPPAEPSLYGFDNDCRTDGRTDGRIFKFGRMPSSLGSAPFLSTCPRKSIRDINTIHVVFTQELWVSKVTCSNSVATASTTNLKVKTATTDCLGAERWQIASLWLSFGIYLIHQKGTKGTL